MSGIARQFNQGWKNRYLLVFLLILFSGFACDDNGEDNDSPVIFGLDAPDFIPVGFTQTIYFHISVDDNQGLDDIESVYFTIENPDGSIRPDTSYMYDNGQDGDITNGDGIYTFAATVLNTPQVEGEYTYRFITEDNDGALSEPIEKVITIGESTRPYIYDLISPEYMQIEFPGTYKLSINASDPQGLLDINSVFFLIENLQGTVDTDTSFMLDNGIGDDEIAGDGIYSYTMSDHGNFTIEGDYVFHFYASDLNDSLSNELTDTIAIDNRVNPYIYDLVAPDSLRKGSTVAAFLSVRLWDPQGNDSVDSVYFYVYRPDGTTSGNNFYMFDDGEVFVSGDSTANDSIYSRGILPPDTSNQSGMYTFYFTAIDAQGNQANTLTKQILAYDPLITTRKNTGEYIRSKKVPNVW